jgi:hypothetical protein
MSIRKLHCITSETERTDMMVVVALLLASEKWTCQFQLPLLILQERWQFFLI